MNQEMQVTLDTTLVLCGKIFSHKRHKKHKSTLFWRAKLNYHFVLFVPFVAKNSSVPFCG